jgi:EpsI family protein
MSKLRHPASSWVPSRRDLLFGGAAAVAAGTAYARMPRKRLMMIGDDELDKIVPQQIGRWHYAEASGLVLPPPDQLAHLLYDQQVARTYIADDLLPIMLLMAYGSSQGGMLQIHRPEICYPASGFRLTATRATQIALGGGHSIPALRFTAHSDTRTEQVLYWTRIGELLPVSWSAQRMAVIRNNLHGYVPDGLLVRVSTISENAEQAREMLQTFTRTMLTELSIPHRRMLIGRADG